MGRVRKQDSAGLEIPRGVIIRRHKHSSSIQIYFSFRGVSCRETLKLEPTKANVKYAANLRAEILNSIAKGTFKYSDYFPDSKRAKLFGHNLSNVTVGELLDEFLVVISKTLQPSTVRGYTAAINAHLRPQFGSLRVRDLSPQLIRVWIMGLQLTAKSIRNTLTPLRLILEQALTDDLIEQNPLDKVVLNRLLNKATSKSDYEIDPLDEKEIRTLLESTNGQLKNLFQFALFTGLRTSELIGLEWTDIDWVNSLVRVQRAVVDKQVKITKTRAGNREVTFFPPALSALNNQKKHTFLHSDRVFHNPKTGAPWETDKQIRESAWRPALKKAGIRYRNPYQTRHTYASMLASNGENLWWLSHQMGHETIEMIMKHYGKWIPDHAKKNGYQSVTDWDKKWDKTAL